jgi:uncharacterized protein (TIGR04255 family)
MSNMTLGTWRKPPLAYVVAELVISPYYSIGDRIPWFQDRLRKGFPRTIEGKGLALEGNKPTMQAVWYLLSADQTHGIQFATRAISLHATGYQDSGEFLGRWAEVLDAIAEAKLDAFVERAGMRYSDLIVPTEDREPSDYVVQQLRGIRPDGAQPTGSVFASGFQFDGHLVNLRVGAPSPAGIILPPELNALPLKMPAVLTEAEKRIKDGKQIGFIDTDCLRDVNSVFNAAELVGVYAGMQRMNSRTFKLALSELAKKEWV